ncbi:MAG: bifunctional adenosylcobinamide kinase/adenosylcobinamide-phosphate guanylyltransferase [Candidatus Rokubacteria bacterium]|nr:bifunctional adenosylcobinamide kinase/adenosylcobinamide-phosphate guanylyltransferase [Candidatus Rokubacteria bacterium]
MSSLFILGGARSGKSRHAIAAHPRRARVAFVATAHAGDGDMAARIARHRAERPAHWTTVEEPFDVPARLATLRGIDAAIVDCVTVWIANRVLRGDADDAILAGGEALAKVVSDAPFDVTLVSNEVGEGVHPETAVGLRFRDLLGIVNQRLAAACDGAVLMVAGLPLTLKTPPPVRHVDQQAP